MGLHYHFTDPHTVDLNVHVEREATRAPKTYSRPDYTQTRTGTLEADMHGDLGKTERLNHLKQGIAAGQIVSREQAAQILQVAVGTVARYVRELNLDLPSAKK